MTRAAADQSRERVQAWVLGPPLGPSPGMESKSLGKDVLLGPQLPVETELVTTTDCTRNRLLPRRYQASCGLEPKPEAASPSLPSALVPLMPSSPVSSMCEGAPAPSKSNHMY